MILAFSLGERVVNHLARRCEGEKLGQSDLKQVGETGWVTRVFNTHYFALAGQENKVAGTNVR
jgi:hypothetical protein